MPVRITTLAAQLGVDPTTVDTVVIALINETGQAAVIDWSDLATRSGVVDNTYRNTDGYVCGDLALLPGTIATVTARLRGTPASAR